ncbi:hypothetical protein FJTKL_00318 [Diaporthe vaccinii]|uniref:Secreted protein n=1 Tax=Diaporthe vaccinii TaxID=105482 RepID=A0ABR4E3M4_9PEZI
MYVCKVMPGAGCCAILWNKSVAFPPARLYWVLTTWSFSTALTCSWFSSVLIESSGKSTLQERRGVSQRCQFEHMQSGCATYEKPLIRL